MRIGYLNWLTRYRTRATLRNIADRLLRDVMLPDGVGGYVGVDALVLRDAKLYVLTIHNVEGAIFAGEKMDQWTVIGHRRSSFRNPLHRMQDQLAALRILMPGYALVPRIVFTGRGHFPKGRPAGAELLEEFAGPLRRPRKAIPAVLDEKLEAAWARLREAAGVLPGKETPEANTRSVETAAH